MPSRGRAAVAVARRTESPERIVTAPPASLASVPVSMVISLSPTLAVKLYFCIVYYL